MGRPKLDMTDLIDSNVDLFMYLIEGLRFGAWKVRRLNWALQWVYNHEGVSFGCTSLKRVASHRVFKLRLWLFETVYIFNFTGKWLAERGMKCFVTSQKALWIICSPLVRLVPIQTYVVLDQIIAGRKQFEETLCDWLLKCQWLDNSPFLPLFVSSLFTGAKEGDICIFLN